MDEALQQRIEDAGVIAVVTVESPDQALPLAETLLEGGVKAIELTLRTDSALASLEKICSNAPDLIVGAGTVLTTEQVKQVKDAGATFAVSPGLNPAIVEAAQAAGLPFGPGVCTPSDIERAVELGCRCLKFFPAEPLGGLKTIRAMAAPFSHLGVRYIPLGGLSPANAGTYLADPSIIALGGSWIAPAKAITEGDWEGIRQRAQEARQLVDEARTPSGD